MTIKETPITYQTNPQQAVAAVSAFPVPELRNRSTEPTAECSRPNSVLQKHGSAERIRRILCVFSHVFVRSRPSASPSREVTIDGK